MNLESSLIPVLFQMFLLCKYANEIMFHFAGNVGTHKLIMYAVFYSRNLGAKVKQNICFLPTFYLK